jgi:hypothetical protein
VQGPEFKPQEPTPPLLKKKKKVDRDLKNDIKKSNLKKKRKKWLGSSVVALGNLFILSGLRACSYLSVSQYVHLIALNVFQFTVAFYSIYSFIHFLQYWDLNSGAYTLSHSTSPLFVKGFSR